MKKELKNKLKKEWIVIEGRIAFLSSIITIILVFTGSSTYFKNILCLLTIVYIFSLVIHIVGRILDTSRAKTELEKSYFEKNRMLSLVMHKYYHNLRNAISSMNSSQITTYRDFVDRCQNICDYITEFYKSLFADCLDNNNICVCIKLIKTDSIFDENYIDWKMDTIARSASTPQARSTIDKKPVSIRENSDFQVILSDKYKDELFSFSNMKNIKDDFLMTYEIPYNNSRGDDFLDHYKSTIVVPIKIDGRYASEKISNYVKNIKEKDIILGFLCIDSLKTFETDKEKRIFSVGVEYAKSFGDSLYLFCEKILLSCLDNTNLNSNGKISNNINNNNHYNLSQKSSNKRKSR